MSSRSTSSGRVLEQLIIPVLRVNGYKFATQQFIGASISGKKHKIDVLVDISDGLQTLVSLKWQQVSGTAEEKVPYEVIKLIHAVKAGNGKYPYAYLVIGGNGWSHVKDFYLNNGLRNYIMEYDLVRIMSLDDFIARANRQLL